MNILAVYKTFKGHEFAAASLQSIYPFVSGVLYLHSDISWTGRRQGNTVREIIQALPDPDKKVEHVTLDDEINHQDDQYNYAIECVKKSEKNIDYILLLDTDEILPAEDFKRALPQLEALLRDTKSPDQCAKCLQYEYIKSPYYRVHPIRDGYKPTLFVLGRAIKKDALRLKGVFIPGRLLENVYLHHLVMVRNSLTENIEKQIDTCAVEKEPMIDIEKWIKDKWNKIPACSDFWMQTNDARYWPGLETIELSNLPAILHDHPIVKAWGAYTTAKYPYIGNDRIPIELFEKFGLPRDFGPAHPDWNVPSKRNRYNKVMAEAALR
ncbi:MAG: hypothetical protein ABSH16_00035 [Sedimentisphaerales bacterium]